MAEASQVGARILRELRRGRSWSWQDQARLLKRLAEQHGMERIAAATTESIGRTIARWESGRYAYKPTSGTSFFSPMPTQPEKVRQPLRQGRTSTA